MANDCNASGRCWNCCGLRDHRSDAACKVVVKDVIRAANARVSRFNLDKSFLDSKGGRPLRQSLNNVRS